MIMEIGIVAGEIWDYLERGQGALAKDIAKGIKRPESLVLMSVGWLGREGHVTVVKKGDALHVTLTKKSSV